MRSREDQCTVNCKKVHNCVTAVLQEHFQSRGSGNKCRSPLLLNNLFFAASLITSIFGAYRSLAHAPTQQTVV